MATSTNDILIVCTCLLIFGCILLWMANDIDKLDNTLKPFSSKVMDFTNDHQPLTARRTSTIKLNLRQGEARLKDISEEDLVNEVLHDLPAEERGERPEWQAEVGWHRKEDIHGNGSNRASSKEDQMKNRAAWDDKIRQLFDLGLSNPGALLDTLENKDPFDVLKPEQHKCSTGGVNGNLDSKTSYDDTNPSKFRAKDDTDGHGFIFYQHLRKAGGTGFCDLAKRNMAQKDVPPYYCMADTRGSLATPPWNDGAYLTQKMKEHSWRVTSNEWDAYNAQQHSTQKGGRLSSAVLATTFRHPVDRWYSQYRFEHLEHRDGSKKDTPRKSFSQYYDNNKDWTETQNYYVHTFDGRDDHQLAKEKTGDFYWTYHKYRNENMSYDMFSRSLKHVQQFHLLLVLEFLDLEDGGVKMKAAAYIQKVLGWKVPPQKTLPHASQADRTLSKSRSIPAKEVLPAEEYRRICIENVFDMLLYHIVRRIALERMCD